MTKLVWDASGTRTYETGVDHGVLYLDDEKKGRYGKAVAWNGLTTVTQSPSGAEPTPLYADNIKYLNLTSAEEFAATIEAYTYPDEFAACDGSYVVPTAGNLSNPFSGITIGQQHVSSSVSLTVPLRVTTRRPTTTATSFTSFTELLQHRLSALTLP